MEEIPFTDEQIEAIAGNYLQLVGGLWQTYMTLYFAANGPGDSSKATQLLASYEDMSDRAEEIGQGWIATLDVPEKVEEVMSLTGEEAGDKQAVAYFVSTVMSVVRPYGKELVRFFEQGVDPMFSVDGVFDAAIESSKTLDLDDVTLEKALNDTASGILVGAAEILSAVI